MHRGLSFYGVFLLFCLVFFGVAGQKMDPKSV
jgi:hypothetical protein